LAGESKSGGLNFSTRKELQEWLESLPPEQGRWVAVAIAARAALRVLPLVETEVSVDDDEPKILFQRLTFAVFFATASARTAAKYPARANRLDLRRSAHAAADASLTTSIPIANAAARSASQAAGAAAEAARTNALTTFYGHASAAVADAAQASATVDDVQAAVSRDADIITWIGAAQELASEPLWPEGEPDWLEDCWWRLQRALPREDDWIVWIDWYNRRLEGVSDPEEIELIFATVPDRERKAGPAAANRWIKERLEELQKKDSSDPPRESAPAPQPIENLPSPFTFGRNVAGQITIVAGPQNTPVIVFPGDEDTLRHWLGIARKRSQRLIADLQAQKFHNVRTA
jgi:hypothetical protein